MARQQVYNQMDLSGGLQASTSHLLKKRNEVVSTYNAEYSTHIGSATRRYGYEKVGQTIEHGADSLGAVVYKYGQNNKIIVGINNTAGTNATLRVLDQNDAYTTILSDASPNTKFQMLNDLDELYACGVSDSYSYMPLTNIDSTLSPSTSRNVYTAPGCKFIAEYQGQLMAINAKVNGVVYPDRAYYSSPPLGAITFVQSAQKGLLQQLKVDSTRYLKVGMSIDIYGAGTEAKKQSAITIVSIDKANKKITFAATAIDVADNDELWLTGRKGKLSHYWNTDDPNPENSDFLRVPPGKEARPEFTGWSKNNNRLFLFTKSSFLKFDGNNLITVSDNIGCVSHESIQNIGNWTIWLHTTGVWGYNDNTGSLKLLSRAVSKYIRSINQINMPYISSIVYNKIYKLSIGEILELDSITTSTSTSSTSTSSTSSSTSSTSTSSTSTSSTSTSISHTTSTSSTSSSSSISTSITTSSSTSSSTSTSSTSISQSYTTSTSSTSASSTSSSTSSTSSSISTSSTSASSSTSISSSTSSTSTSTLPSSKECIVLCYDFDGNSWWAEKHKREHRYQFIHTMHGYTKPYFTDETGRLFRDETGNLDNNESIPMEIELGRNSFGTDQKKNYLSILVDSDNARGTIVQYSVDGGQFRTLGQITNKVTILEFPHGGQQIVGRDINYKITHNDKGDTPVINGIGTYYSAEESLVYEQ